MCCFTGELEYLEVHVRECQCGNGGSLPNNYDVNVQLSSLDFLCVVWISTLYVNVFIGINLFLTFITFLFNSIHLLESTFVSWLMFGMRVHLSLFFPFCGLGELDNTYPNYKWWNAFSIQFKYFYWSLHKTMCNETVKLLKQNIQKALLLPHRNHPLIAHSHTHHSLLTAYIEYNYENATAVHNRLTRFTTHIHCTPPAHNQLLKIINIEASNQHVKNKLPVNISIYPVPFIHN